MPLNSKITGVSEVSKVLRQLPPSVEKRVVDGALRAGARVFRNEIATRAKHRVLKENVAVKTQSKGQRKADPVRGDVFVGFRFPASKLAHLFEFGTAPRFQKSTGRFTGQIQPTPTVRPAFESKKNEVVKKTGQALGKGVEREAKKLAGPLTRKQRARLFR